MSGVPVDDLREAHPSGTYDVVIVGGGPGGATTGGLLARAGYSVLIVEKEEFPRFHVGESLISGMFPALDRLGARERIDSHGFELKTGISLVWGAEHEHWNIRFADLGPHTYSWHVDRADFDSILLDVARESGAEVASGRVLEPLVIDQRVCGVVVEGASGARRALRSRFVVDASGRQRVIARHMTSRTWNPRLKNTATWGYWSGTDRLPGELRHNTLIERCTDGIGWFWAIPLAGDRLSVGHVRPAGDFVDLAHEPEGWAERVEAAPWTMALLSDAAQSDPFRTTSDWSYRSDAFAGPGWAAVGDSAAFIDPLLSTGLCLAILAADGLAELLDAVLGGSLDEPEAVDVYCEDLGNLITVMTNYVEFFYDPARDLEDHAQRAASIVSNAEQYTSQENMTRVLAGVMGRGRLIGADV